MRRRRRRIGFTLVELMITITIVGLLARIAIPRVSQFRLRARASRIVGDLEVIRGAAFHVVADSGYWPADGGVGSIPPAMSSYLPPAMTFNPEAGVSYSWRLSGMPNGDPAQATDGTTMGMGAQVDDDALRVELQRQLAQNDTMMASGVVYWLIWGPTVRP
jgi:prepilin-type N-terminal cleavage/methylation domain-containing protein